MRVVLYGSRPDGHARVVLEVLLAERAFEVIGLIDDVPANAERSIGEMRVVGSRKDLRRLRNEGVEGVVVGFGSASGRVAVADAIEEAGLALPVLVHPSAYVAPSASLERGAQVLPQASVGPGARLGRCALLNTGATVEHDVVVCDCAVVDPGAVLAGRAEVGSSAEIGAGAVLLPDVEVGARAVVGAGAVVTRPVAEADTVVGVPARPVRR